jgi:hypothetical protein
MYGISESKLRSAIKSRYLEGTTNTLSNDILSSTINNDEIKVLSLGKNSIEIYVPLDFGMEIELTK